ncbi:hypothetical protein [Streptomyces pristinaespiralis]|uniref:hypothetical protein n=1 Tax=Streptomyces pristinaespiralis TaxID=38300 RepID=UPI0033E682E4
MVDETRAADRRAQLTQERRDAYFAALRVAEVDVRRLKYKQNNETEKLGLIDQYWTRSKRAEISAEALIAVHTFGSPQARLLAEAWRDAAEAEDMAEMKRLVHEFRELTRSELLAP